MKRNILFISCLIILFTCSCKNNELNNIKVNEIKIADNAKKETLSKNKEEITREEPKQIESPEIKKTEPTTKRVIPTENKVTIEENKPTNQDKVLESHPDYQIHKGRIDCHNEDECMKISLPLQFKYKDIIANTFYTEVISENNNLLGYFIEYVFEDGKYENKEKCDEKGKAITEELSDRITNYECSDEGLLTIVTDY